MTLMMATLFRVVRITLYTMRARARSHGHTSIFDFREYLFNINLF